MLCQYERINISKHLQCSYTLYLRLSYIKATENQIQKKKMLDVIFPELKTDGSGVATYKEVPFTTSAGVCKAQGGLKNAAVA